MNKNAIEMKLKEICKKNIGECSYKELYTALLHIVEEESEKHVEPVTGRKLYYISAGFLIGKLLSNNLINLGMYDEVKELLEANGKIMAQLEETEPESSLGNGGLGRLAACFLDSLATLNLPGDGIGLRYHCGLFKQKFEQNLQNEVPDLWLGEDDWTKKNLFDLDTIDPSVIGKGISFDKNAIDKNLTLFLYPDDSDEAVQINDTHPSMVIPELIRLLEEKGIAFEEAVEIVTKLCAYTNHTILAEALEKWPRHFLDKVVPQLMPIIEKLDKIVKEKYGDKDIAIIDENNKVHMAHMDIHFSHSTNGVAALHTEILKNSELNHFYKLYPERFNNKTNGITFRRWLLKCNPRLTAFIEKLIGPGFKKNAEELEKLSAFVNDDAVLEELMEIKKYNKSEFADWLLKKQGITVKQDSMFTIQSKRLHEYKRQQLNLLYLIHQYFEIKAGNIPQAPITAIFGAKAAPAYTIAKDIIHALLALSEVIEKDPEVSKWMQIVFIENYNVAAAEKMIPACDLSEQISLASKEASGTGNMKFMLNGALTLGTMDGANVEIAEAVGEENIYIFGQSSNQVIRRYAHGDYCAKEWYDIDGNIKRAINFLTGEEMMACGQEENLKRLKNELINKDWFQTLPDFNAYIDEYNDEIWKL